MGRHRDWDPVTWAEVVVRADLGQAATEIAKATGISIPQASHFLKQRLDDPSKVPGNLRLPSAELLTEIEERVRGEVAAEQAALVGPEVASPEEIDAAVEGCLETLRVVASQLGITTRNFLWRCTTHARSVE